MKRIVFATLSLLFAAAVHYGQGSGPQQQPSKPVVPDPSLDYIIGPNDLLEIKVWKEPDLSTKVTVRPDGKIGVTALNDVQAGGLTTKQLQEEITKGLEPLFREDPPLVSVDILEIRSQVVHITGSVPKPGQYRLTGPLTIVELIAQAGGLTEFTKGNQIQVVRREGSVYTRIPFDYQAYESGERLHQNINLKSGDIVTVK